MAEQVDIEAICRELDEIVERGEARERADSVEKIKLALKYQRAVGDFLQEHRLRGAYYPEVVEALEVIERYLAWLLYREQETE